MVCVRMLALESSRVAMSDFSLCLNDNNIRSPLYVAPCFTRILLDGTASVLKSFGTYLALEGHQSLEIRSTSPVHNYIDDSSRCQYTRTPTSFFGFTPDYCKPHAQAHAHAHVHV